MATRFVRRSRIEQWVTGASATKVLVAEVAEIIVTAARWGRSVQVRSCNITEVTDTRFDDARVLNLDEITRMVAGLNFVDQGNQ